MSYITNSNYSAFSGEVSVMYQTGKRIKLKRKSLGLTQSEYSKLLGIAQGYLSEIENGVKIPSNKLVLLHDHISRSQKEENFKQKYLELAKEHMTALETIYSLKQKLLSLDDTSNSFKNSKRKT